MRVQSSRVIARDQKPKRYLFKIFYDAFVGEMRVQCAWIRILWTKLNHSQNNRFVNKRKAIKSFLVIRFVLFSLCRCFVRCKRSANNESTKTGFLWTFLRITRGGMLGWGHTEFLVVILPLVVNACIMMRHSNFTGSGDDRGKCARHHPK